MALFRVKPWYKKKGGGVLSYYGTATSLSAARHYLAATSIGNYALFGGGSSDGGLSNTVDAYDTSLTRTNPTSLSVARHYLAATSIGNYALFGGGSSNGRLSQVDAYDTSLTRTNPTSLSTPRSYLAATSISNYALFGGGYSDGGYSNTVDVYQVS